MKAINPKHWLSNLNVFKNVLGSPSTQEAEEGRSLEPRSWK
jgi:hypothetical protein